MSWESQGPGTSALLPATKPTYIMVPLDAKAGSREDEPGVPPSQIQPLNPQ